MATTPRRWPMDVDHEREQALRAAMEAAQHLNEAQQKVDLARPKVHSNQSLATILLAETDRAVSDALTCMERIRRLISVARASTVHGGRWPIVAAKQRDDAMEAAEAASNLLDKAQDTITKARERASQNPSLVEAMIADIALFQAKAKTQAERISRVLTEASLGRE